MAAKAYQTINNFVHGWCSRTWCLPAPRLEHLDPAHLKLVSTVVTSSSSNSKNLTFQAKCKFIYTLCSSNIRGVPRICTGGFLTISTHIAHGEKVNHIHNYMKLRPYLWLVHVMIVLYVRRYGQKPSCANPDSCSFYMYFMICPPPLSKLYCQKEMSTINFGYQNNLMCLNYKLVQDSLMEDIYLGEGLLQFHHTVHVFPHFSSPQGLGVHCSKGGLQDDVMVTGDIRPTGDRLPGQIC